MRRRRFQNIVSSSPFSLPIVAAITVVLWIANGMSYSLTPDDGELWSTLHERLPSIAARNVAALVLCGITAYLVAELNNENALIRIRTRMMSVVFLVFMGGFVFLHPLQVGHVAMVCLLLSYHTLFRTYQRYDSVGYTFHAFFFIAFASLFYSKLLFLIPFYLIALKVHLHSFTLKSFFAALLGVVLPYWMWAVYLFYHGRIEDFLRPFEMLLLVEAPDYSVLTPQQMVAFCIVSVLALIAIVHTVRTEFADKIRVRMLFHFFIMIEVALIAGLALHPENFNILFILFVVNSSTFISHMFALTSNRVSNALFIVSLSVMVLFTLYNIWITIVSY